MLIRGPDGMTIENELAWLAAQVRGGEAKATAPKPRGNPERDFQVDQVAWLRDVLPAGSVVAAIKNEHRADATSPRARARFYAKRREEGVQDGMPDLSVALPGARVVWIENKSRRGTLTKAQRETHAALRAIGHAVIVARTIEQTRAGLIAAGVALLDVGAPRPAASNDAEKISTPGRSTVRARVGGSTFALPADKLPQGWGG